jgi:NADPH:quinone reductase-like Zn-dependent oxidoreductase
MTQALQITRHGGPEVLQWRDVPSPQLTPDGVRVEVSAAGVNFADIMMRMGLYPEAPKPPFIPGYEVSGKVIEIGAQVKHLKLGDRVFGGTRFGGYTSEIVLPADQLRLTPEGMSDIEAAAIPVNFLTAWVALQEMARVRKGDRVVIQSAAGGVGVAAVQIAAQAGARVTGLVGSSKKFELVKSLGAQEVLTYDEWDSQTDSAANGYQIILDSMGGKSLKQAMRRIAPGGRVVNFGVSNMVSGKKRSLTQILSVFSKTLLITPYALMMKNQGIFGLNMLQLFEPPVPGQFNLMHHSLDQLMERFKDRSFKVIVGKTFPMTEGGAAQTFLQSRSNVGKVVLTRS